MNKTSDGLPLIGLLGLSTTAFLTILTETMPAAVLPQMSASFQRSPAAIGYLVSAYAVASAVAAIPLVAWTRSIPRRRLLLTLLAGFAGANAVTALSTSYPFTVAARVAAGAVAGVSWPVVCGYALRLAEGKNQGRALAITLAGSTVAMLAGLPLGSLLGSMFGWRATFGVLAGLAMALMAWARLALPATEGEAVRADVSFFELLRTPGMRLILLMTTAAILAHYTAYTYIAPLSAMLHLPGGTGQGLLLFGVGALVSVVVVGRFVDGHLRGFTLGVVSLTALVMAAMLNPGGNAAVLHQAVILLWGLSFGGLPTLVQSAVNRVAGSEAEAATAMITTTYNVGITGGGIIGGLLLTSAGVRSLPAFALASSLVALSLVIVGKQHAFRSTSA